MLNDYTYLGIVLDRSGSMLTIKSSVISGFNELIDNQKNVKGKCDVCLCKFSSDVFVEKSISIDKINYLSNENYIPDGMTALYKAIYQTIESIGEELRCMHESERPSKVMVVIITDGEENYSNHNNDMFIFTRGLDFLSDTKKSSISYTSELINSMITHQKEKYNWEFLFIGTSDINAKEIARSFNISKTMSFEKSSNGTQEMYKNLNSMVTSYRTTGDF